MLQFCYFIFFCLSMVLWFLLQFMTCKLLPDKRYGLFMSINVMWREILSLANSCCFFPLLGMQDVPPTQNSEKKYSIVSRNILHQLRNYSNTIIQMFQLETEYICSNRFVKVNIQTKIVLSQMSFQCKGCLFTEKIFCSSTRNVINQWTEHWIKEQWMFYIWTDYK